MESNTKFGVALIVLLLGTLGVVVYKKMERRRTELAAAQVEGPAASAESEQSSAPPGRDRAAGSRRSRYDESDPSTSAAVARQAPPQSEPALDERGAHSAAYRPTAASRSERSQDRDWLLDGSSRHPLRRAADVTQPSTPGHQPNPFDRPSSEAASSSAQTAASSAASNPFDQPAADGASHADSDAEAGLTRVVAAEQGEPVDAGGRTSPHGSPFDAAAQTAQQDTSVGDELDAAVDARGDAGWSAAGSVQIQAATSTSVQSEVSPGSGATPVSHDAPWSQQGAGAATHAIGSQASQTPPFTPVRSGYEDLPRSAPPTPQASLAEESPWDAVGSSAAAADRDPFEQVSPPPPQAGDRPAAYTVRRGDNYWQISRKQYGTGRYFQALMRYNAQRIPDPRRMRPGMKVLIPDRQILESRYADLIPGRSTRASAALPSGLFQAAGGELMYRVGRNDTLGLIAQRHLGRWTRWAEIYRLNQDRLSSPTTLKIGLELRLPVDASRVRVVSGSAERR